jgi:serine/threonine protein kinase
MFPAEQIPETIGAYRVVQRLSQGGAADVYLARNEGPLGYQRECELKLLPDTSEGNPEFAEELGREAAICARLKNAVVVRVFDFFEHQGKLVLAVEHVEGTTLAELLSALTEKRQKLGDAAVYYIGARLADAIADAHAATDDQGNPTPIVHRNLTPSNVLLSVEGEVRLTGFGVGKILGRTPDTAIGRVKGTPGFMAPEQTRGEPVTTKSDVYGLGVLLWSMLAGRLPPTDGTWPRRISGLRTDLPREVAAVIDAALDHFPGTRKISAREMERWLAKAAPAARGKAELKERVAALRGEGGAHVEDEAPPPSRRLPSLSGSASAGAAPASQRNPFQGVRFGPPADTGAPARTLAKRAVESRAPREPPRPGEPQRMATGTALSRVVLALPPPPPPEAPRPEASRPEVPRPEAPRPTPPAAPRFGAPPTPPTPPAPRFGAPPAPPIGATPGELAGEGPLAAEVAAFSSAAPAEASPPPGTVMPKPSILPAAGPMLAAVAMLPRSSLLGIPPPSAEMLERARLNAAEPAAPVHEPAPSPAPPPASAAPRRPTAPLGTTVLVSAVTAALVAVSIYLLVLHGHDGARPAPVASAPASAAAPPPPPPADASAAPAPAAPATASAAAAVTANPADLPYGYGYLTVASPASADVYLSGKIAGPVNQPLKVRCGRFFVRLAAPGESRYPEWVSGGETVVITCQQLTRLEMGPKPQQ